MPVQAFISISYAADSAEEVQAFIDRTAFPEGAAVSAQISESLAGGVVQDGRLQAPADPAASAPEPAQEAPSEPPAEAPAQAPAETPPDGTVQEVLDWVGVDQARAQAALDAELAGQNRPTLITQLEALLAPAAP